MNRSRILLATVIASLVALLLSGTSTLAFHEGGEGYCEGCHKIVSTQNHEYLGTNESSDPEPTRLILKGSDPSSTCLLCHAKRGEAYRVLTNDGSAFNPGGDYYWLQKTFTWTNEGRSCQSKAESHGHNIVALDYGLHMDGRLSHSPGGRYPAAALGCTSCHDPHAKTSGNSGMASVLSFYVEEPSTETPPGTFRLLGGVGYEGGQPASGTTFRYSSPIAEGSSSGSTETDSNHTAYGSGMSEWCANCHGDFLNNNVGSQGRSHPSGNNVKITGQYANNYNSYISTGDLNGSQGSAYLALVPVEVGTGSKALLNPSSSSGPGFGGSANVMCLTCHRAHASAFESIGRWDFGAARMADSHPQEGDGGASGTDALHSYYGRNIIAEFGENQRQLCNKCHLKD